MQLKDLTADEAYIIAAIRQRTNHENESKQRILGKLIPKIGTIKGLKKTISEQDDILYKNNRDIRATQIRAAAIERLSMICCHVQPVKSFEKTLNDECGLWQMQCALCNADLFVHVRDEIGTAGLIVCNIDTQIPFPTIDEVLQVISTD
jgi:hypothetical protein